MPVKATGFQ